MSVWACVRVYLIFNRTDGTFSFLASSRARVYSPFRFSSSTRSLHTHTNTHAQGYRFKHIVFHLAACRHDITRLIKILSFNMLIKPNRWSSLLSFSHHNRFGQNQELVKDFWISPAAVVLQLLTPSLLRVQLTLQPPLVLTQWGILGLQRSQLSLDGMYFLCRRALLLYRDRKLGLSLSYSRHKKETYLDVFIILKSYIQCVCVGDLN